MGPLSVSPDGLLIGIILILYFEFSKQPLQLFFIVAIYAILTPGSGLNP